MAEALIKWSDTYNLGLKEVDEQHKSLLDLINKIWQSIIDRNEKDNQKINESNECHFNRDS